jgi:hypothetical protein
MPKFTLDLRFVFLERELWALGEFLKVIEPQVTYLCDQDRIQTHARLSEQGYTWDDADLQLGLQDLDQRARIVFPRLLRNPFLVTLWAAYESGVAQIAADLARTTNTGLMLRDIRAHNSLDSAIKYYAEVVRTVLDLDNDRLGRLARLQALRNVVAHANGEQRAVSSERWNAVEKLLAGMPEVSVHDGYLIVSEEYLTAAYRDVSESLLDLIQRVRGPSVRLLGPKRMEDGSPS